VHLRGRAEPSEPALRVMGWAMEGPRRFAAAQTAGRAALRAGVPLPAWTKGRDLPPAPKETFRQWWRRTRG
jgi:L-lactate dehydrogenase complex protein LldF